jgi:hypothetical protein
MEYATKRIEAKKNESENAKITPAMRDVAQICLQEYSSILSHFLRDIMRRGKRIITTMVPNRPEFMEAIETGEIA